MQNKTHLFCIIFVQLFFFLKSNFYLITFIILVNISLPKTFHLGQDRQNKSNLSDAASKLSQFFFFWQTGARSLEWWFTSSGVLLCFCYCSCSCPSTLSWAANSLPLAPAAPHPPPLPQPAPLPHCRSSLSPHQRSVAPFPLPPSLLSLFPSSGALVFLVHFFVQLVSAFAQRTHTHYVYVYLPSTSLTKNPQPIILALAQLSCVVVSKSLF